MRKKLILVAAPSACGKTYVSELLAHELGHTVYLDKDDLGDLIRRAFQLCGEPADMDGEFYINNLRPAEYSVILQIALSALRFEDTVLLNAPFGREVRDPGFMSALKEHAHELNAELILIWVTAPLEVCRERMIRRNSPRDTMKLLNWDEYVKKVNYTVPYSLETDRAVDRLLIFDTSDDTAVQDSLSKTLKVLKQET